jgi:hypothetical protein
MDRYVAINRKTVAPWLKNSFHWNENSKTFGNRFLFV